MSRVKVTRARFAGANARGEQHRVVRVQGGPCTYRREPCPTCPWRLDAVGEFPAEAFRISAHTAFDQAMESFACHTSGTKRPAICAGFLLRGADHNIIIRLRRMEGRISDDVRDGGVELFDSYRAMAIANGVAPNDPILRRCR